MGSEVTDDDGGTCSREIAPFRRREAGNPQLSTLGGASLFLHD
jgi:hypothetical protein